MARRGSKGSTAVADETEAQASDTETAIEETTPEATTESAPAATKADLSDDEIDARLGEFKETVAAAVDQRDATVGTMSDEVLRTVTNAYTSLDGGPKVKNAAKKYVQAQMTDAMNQMSQEGVVLARAYFQIQEEALVAKRAAKGTGERRVREPVNPTEAFVERAASLALAAELVGAEVPEGVDDDWLDKANTRVAELQSGDEIDTYRTWLLNDAEDKGDAPEVSPIVIAAVKLALGRTAKPGKKIRPASSGSTYTGERRDVGKHITEAFDGKASGTFLLVSEIAKFASNEYGDDRPSSGAVSARLFPPSGKCTVEGITPGQNELGRKGAFKD